MNTVIGKSTLVFLGAFYRKGCHVYHPPTCVYNGHAWHALLF